MIKQKISKVVLLSSVAFLSVVSFYLVFDYGILLPDAKKNIALPVQTGSFISPSPTIFLVQPPEKKIIPTEYHVFQTFNNCGPAALSMALRFYGITESQQVLGEALRPYQVKNGDNDDKSVTLEELAEKSKYYGLVPFHRPGGDIEMIKYFISYDIPVIVRTLTKVGEDVGHYRVVKGYDDEKRSIIQDDSLQNNNLWFEYEMFHRLWKTYNYEYLVLIPPDKVGIADQILKQESEKDSWKRTLQNEKKYLEEHPHDIYSRLNVSVAYYHLGEYQKSIDEFKAIEHQLPFRTLWYQIEPILSYYAVGDDTKVLQITEKILHNHNKAFSELYLLRGEIYKKQGNIESARNEFQQAVLYNKHFRKAHDALASL